MTERYGKHVREVAEQVRTGPMSERRSQAIRSRPQQRQDSLTDQMVTVLDYAERELGCYDAADWIRKNFGAVCVTRIYWRCGRCGYRALTNPYEDFTNEDGQPATEAHRCPTCGDAWWLDEASWAGTNPERRAEVHSLGALHIPPWVTDVDRYVKEGS